MVIGSAFGRITARLLWPVSSSFTTGAELKHFAKAGLSLNYPADVNLKVTDTEKGKENVSREERYLTDGCDPNSVAGNKSVRINCCPGVNVAHTASHRRRVRL